MANRILAMRQSVFVGVFLIFGSIVFGVGSYVGIRNMTIQSAETELGQLTSRVTQRLEKKIVSRNVVTDLQAPSRLQERFRNDDQRFLCVIDLEGRCTFHPRNPEMVGKIVMQGDLIDSKTGVRPRPICHPRGNRHSLTAAISFRSAPDPKVNESTATDPSP